MYKGTYSSWKKRDDEEISGHTPELQEDEL